MTYFCNIQLNEKSTLMKVLKLTILLESHISKSTLMNTFGKCIELGDKYRFVQFTFPSIRMLTTIQLKPIHDLVKIFEDTHNQLKLKMFHLYDDVDHSYSPFSIHCLRGKWYTVSSATLQEMNTADSLFGLF